MSFQVIWNWGQGRVKLLEGERLASGERLEISGDRTPDDTLLIKGELASGESFGIEWKWGGSDDYDCVVVQDDRDDAMSYRIDGNRKVGYTLHHCGARPPYYKTGMLQSMPGSVPTLFWAIKSLLSNFKSDWTALNLGFPSDYGSLDGLHRRVWEVRLGLAAERERPLPRRVLPPHLRCQMAPAAVEEATALDAELGIKSTKK